MKKIRAEELREKGACESQVRKFEKQWPDGATITKANCLIALKLELDVEWAAEVYLSGSALRTWRKRNEESMDERQAVWREAGKLRDTKAITPNEYDRRRTQAYADDYKRIWLAFWRCWRSMQKKGAAKRKK